MREIFPGVLHWERFHEETRSAVSSHYIAPVGMVIGPMVPEGGFAAFDGRTRPQVVLLTSARHLRHAERYRDELGCLMRAPAEAAEILGDRIEVDAFDEQDELVPGVTTIKMELPTRDEYAFHITATEGALAIGDAIGKYGSLGFPPDEFLGDDPKKTQDGIKNRLQAQLQRDFEHLLFSHGDP
jgi:glyoxylase-like metal-dependent hydrolase (beta-lactamase superfamily II)